MAYMFQKRHMRTLRAVSLSRHKRKSDPYISRHIHLSFADFEQLFWSRVWRCTHRHPCKRCCWPWKSEFAKGRHAVRPSYGHMMVPHLRQNMPAHRLAFIFAHHALLLPFGNAVHVCHLCDFPPCCNPSHLVVGTHDDNIGKALDRIYESSRMRGPIRLPNGVEIMIDYRLLPRR